MTMENHPLMVGKDPSILDAAGDSPLDDSLLDHEHHDYDHDIDHSGLDQSGLDPQQQPPPKRKGGRKPIYATSEERKQRNRQAQAAFRERRTEYIKNMEITMKENEEILETLRQEHREMTDQCHMLRYKTSLLEELLDERGIDFRAELQARSSRSMLGQPRPQVVSPAPRVDQIAAIKRRSANGANIRGERAPKASAAASIPASAVRHPLDSPQSSAPSPSAFNFPNLSTDVQDFDPNHNGETLHRTVGNDIYEPATHRSHLPSGLARVQHNMMQHNAYAQAAQPQPYGGPDDSYDYNQEQLRPSQARLNSHRLGK